jgi:hypothetical protein
MADLFDGQTRTYGASYVADGGAYTFTLPFQPDRIFLFNYTQSGTDLKVPISIWYRGMPAGDAIQIQKMANDGGSDGSSVLLEATNGFTEANTSGGVSSYLASISGATKADPCVITTSAVHGFATGDLVRMSDLGNLGAVDRGMDQLDGNRYRITVLTTTTFSLQDPITGDDIDSTSFDTYVSGGFANLESRAGDEKFAYDPVVYKVTFGTAVAGDDSDVVYFEAMKFGTKEVLGDIA